MFNLESAIADWRREVSAGGLESLAVLDELEGHLRDDVECRKQSGLSEEEAFAAAVRQMGRAEVLKNEFSNARETLYEELKILIHKIADIPNPQLAAAMHAPDPIPALENRWATYLRTTLFVIPAVFLWLFSSVFLTPKLNAMCQQAGTALFRFSDAPAVVRAIAYVGQVMIFLTHHALLLSGAILLILFVLECRSGKWPRYRGTALGIGAFMLNLGVLVTLTLMVLTAILVSESR